MGKSKASTLQRQLERLLEGQADDSRLRDNLEGLAHDEALPGLTWFWGPILYARNRVVFRSFIQNHFSSWATESRRWTQVKWSTHAERLEPWLASARKNRDTSLVRQLLRWKYSGRGWQLDNAAWNAALVAAYQEASGPAARAIVLNEFDDWFELDEDTAVALYETDPQAGPFVLRHLPRNFWGEDKRVLWTRLAGRLQEAGDEDSYWTLYRKQVPFRQWRAEVLALSEHIQDAEELNAELAKRHLEGYGLKFGATLVALLERRGRDVMPYVREKIASLLGGWIDNSPERFVAIAEKNGWWDLWATAIRITWLPKLFNKAITQLLDDARLPETERLSRLKALAGVSREWNWPGFGMAQVHPLDDELAVRLYRRYPELIRGPFKPHILPRWWQGNPKLLEAAQTAGDEELVDLMAGRYATQVQFENAYGRSKEYEKIRETVDSLGTYYQAIRDQDPKMFARRAANLLTQIPAFSIFSYAQLLKTNKLARLLFVRSFDAFLAVPSAVRDLVEGSDIHVQMLAYNVLAQDDVRARRLAVETLDILIGTLLRPLHRKTRLAAFQALANASRDDGQAAAVIYRRAREAMRLPDKKYPKEELVGLLGHILKYRPELRGPREQPVVYGLEEAAR